MGALETKLPRVTSPVPSRVDGSYLWAEIGKKLFSSKSTLVVAESEAVIQSEEFPLNPGLLLLSP